MVGLWAERNVVVADEFGDGNVPAQKDPLRVAQRAGLCGLAGHPPGAILPGGFGLR